MKVFVDESFFRIILKTFLFYMEIFSYKSEIGTKVPRMVCDSRTGDIWSSSCRPWRPVPARAVTDTRHSNFI